MRTRGQKGFSVVEMVIYFGMLILFTLVVVTTLISFSKSYRSLRVAHVLADSGSLALDRIAREIKTASNVNTAQSVLGTSPGTLALDTTNEDGYTQSISFALQNGVVNLYENSTLVDRLTSTKASTTNLIFRLITTGNTKAVKVEMTLTAGSGEYARTEHFYVTSELRNSI